MAFTQNIEAMKLCQDNVAPVSSVVYCDNGQNIMFKKCFQQLNYDSQFWFYLISNIQKTRNKLFHTQKHFTILTKLMQ